MTQLFRYDPKEVEEAVENALDEFYGRRIEKLNSITLWDVLKRKNPYLFKASGYETAQEVVENILSAYMSSSEETIFGDVFFEELAIKASGGIKSSADSVDLEVREDGKVKLYAVKSGPHVFNAQSRRRQEQAFQEAINRLRRQVKEVEAIIGYAYGKKRQTEESRQARPRNYREVAGKEFWEELTGDPDFYLKIVDLIGEKPKQHAERYRKAYASAVNRLSRELLDNFCGEDGLIDWRRLVECVSGDRPYRRRKTLGGISDA